MVTRMLVDYGLLPWVVMGPLCIAVICFLVSHRQFIRAVSIMASITLVAYSCVLAFDMAASEQQHYIYSMAGWDAPLGIALMLTPLSSILLAMTAVVLLAISIYACGYFTDIHQEQRYWQLWWLLVASINGIFVAADIFNVYVMLELMGLSAVGLIALQRNISTLKAAYQYLLIGLLGSLFYLLGIALLYREYGLLDITLLSDIVENSAISQIAMVLITLGLLLKTALFPLHFWLPNAHSTAPAPVSAALSGIVVKATYFLLFHFWFVILAPVVTQSATLVIGLLGACAVFLGSWRAFHSRRLKLIVAYSTIAQLGYLFVLFPLFYVSPELAKPAMIYFIVAHAFAKAAMFMAVGSIQKIAGSDDIEKLSGVAIAMPTTIFTFAVAGASLIGLPPSAGFIAKWLMLSSAIQTDQWFWILVMLGGGLLTATYLFRVLNRFFTHIPGVFDKNKVRGQDFRSWAGLALAVLTIALGLNALWLFESISVDSVILAGGL